jgi:Fe-S cluster biosynthesis and repair protein YggX
MLISILVNFKCYIIKIKKQTILIKHLKLNKYNKNKREIK